MLKKGLNESERLVVGLVVDRGPGACEHRGRGKLFGTTTRWQAKDGSEEHRTEKQLSWLRPRDGCDVYT
jgi:hypothetical protein